MKRRSTCLQGYAGNTKKQILICKMFFVIECMQHKQLDICYVFFLQFVRFRLNSVCKFWTSCDHQLCIHFCDKQHSDLADSSEVSEFTGLEKIAKYLLVLLTVEIIMYKNMLWNLKYLQVLPEVPLNRTGWLANFSSN